VATQGQKTSTANYTEHRGALGISAIYGWPPVGIDGVLRGGDSIDLGTSMFLMARCLPRTDTWEARCLMGGRVWAFHWLHAKP